jgi:large subunit ribosomal protein L6
MSRLSKKLIPTPSDVTVEAKGGTVVVKGPKGEHALPVLPFVEIVKEEGGIRVKMRASHKQAVMNSGTMWALILNAVRGVKKGFVKSLELSGVGYRALLEGKTLILHLGFTEPIRFRPPSGVTVDVQKNVITVSGIDKELVGRVAAEIRALKKPEPYKGKGISYQGEVIRRKAGKKAAAAAA